MPRTVTMMKVGDGRIWYQKFPSERVVELIADFGWDIAANGLTYEGL